MRIDKYISEKYWFSRNKVQQFIDAGLILKNSKKITKSSEKVEENDKIEILEDRRIHWVSRSAEKLFGFLENHQDYKNKVTNAICLDIGSSTGGFSQVLIENNAKIVDAVDVGTNQLSPILRKNPKIFSYEQTDIRDFESSRNYDFIVCDASFISLNEILDDIIRLSNSETEIIVLFKPQFEVEKIFLTKNGLPKNEKIILEAMEKFEKNLEKNFVKIIHKEKSTLLGEEWNQEYIYAIKKIPKD